MASSVLFDRKVHCVSALTEMSVGEYLQLVGKAYDNRGALTHQRTALKTASGRRIRERMVRDVIGGAVLPPLVIGVVGEKGSVEQFKTRSAEDVLHYVRREYPDAISIIDGMQRTTALYEAVSKDPGVENQTVRVEAWLGDQVESLIYRMLILNSGQVPWNLKQQLRVVYENLVSELYAKVDFSRLLQPGERRWRAGEFNSDDLIETYIAFGLRKTEVETQQNLAEEFSKLDIAESVSEGRYDEYFFPIVQMLVNLDRVFSRFDPPFELVSQEKSRARRVYDKGKNIFDTQPPRIGFVVANAVRIFGRTGMNRDKSITEAEFASLTAAQQEFVERLGNMSEDQLGEFLALDVLTEALSTRPTSAVGRWERNFWETAFKVLLEERYAVDSMVPCWRAGY
jgi:hypothetical protein